jgi:hypothetical protein
VSLDKHDILSSFSCQHFNEGKIECVKITIL